MSLFKWWYLNRHLCWKVWDTPRATMNLFENFLNHRITWTNDEASPRVPRPINISRPPNSSRRYVSYVFLCVFMGRLFLIHLLWDIFSWVDEQVDMDIPGTAFPWPSGFTFKNIHGKDIHRFFSGPPYLLLVHWPTYWVSLVMRLIYNGRIQHLSSLPLIP